MSKAKKGKQHNAPKGKQAYEVQQNIAVRLARREQETAAHAEANRKIAIQFAAQYALDPHTNPPTNAEQLRPLLRQFEYLIRAGDYSAALAVLDQVVEVKENGSNVSFVDKLYWLSFIQGSDLLAQLLVPAAAPQLGLDRMAELLGKLNLWSVPLLVSNDTSIVAVNSQMLRLFEQAGHRQGMINALEELVNHYIASSEAQPALDYQQRMMPLVEQSGSRVEIISAIMTLAYIYTMLKRPALAAEQRARIDRMITEASDVQDKLAIIVEVMGSSRIGDRWTHEYVPMAIELASQVDINSLDYNTALWVASFYRGDERNAEAAPYLLRAADMAEQSGNYSRTYSALSELYELYDDLERGAEAFDTLLRLERVSEPSLQPSVRLSIIEDGIKLGRWDDVLTYAEQLWEATGQTASGNELTQLLVWLIAIYRGLGREQDAEFYWQRLQGMISGADPGIAKMDLLHHLSHQALEARLPYITLDVSIRLDKLTEENNDPLMRLTALRDRATAYVMLLQPELALTTWFEVIKLAEESDEVTTVAVTLVNIGQLYEALDRDEQALEYYQRAAQKYDENGEYEEQAETLELLAMIQDKLHQHDEAAATRLKIKEIEDEEAGVEDGTFPLLRFLYQLVKEIVSFL
jgi:tetratricopeptide (TPR) repeat protein